MTIQLRVLSLGAHRSIKPLREVNFDTGVDDLWGNECEGMCGV